MNKSSLFRIFNLISSNFSSINRCICWSK